MNDITIIIPNILDLFSLRKMFKKAIFEEYELYDYETKQKILNRYSIQSLISAKLKAERILYVGINNRKIVGVIIGTYANDGIGTINWIYVLPEYRENHIATKLLKELEKEFIKHRCHKMVVTTEVAKDFYRKLGFKEELLLKKHWWKKDFYVFTKTL